MSPKNTSVLKLLNGMRHFGVGCKVTRSTYRFPQTYWIITKVKLGPNQDFGKVKGLLVWRGRVQPKERDICTPYKKEWNLVSVPNYKEFSGTRENVDSMIAKEREISASLQLTKVDDLIETVEI